MLNMRFNIHSYTQHYHTDHESSQRAGRKPSPLLTKREAQCERSQSAGQHDRSHRIEALMLLPLWTWLPINVPRGQEDEQADGHIDVKDPAPGQKVRNEPPNSRP